MNAAALASLPKRQRVYIDGRLEDSIEAPADWYPGQRIMIRRPRLPGATFLHGPLRDETYTIASITADAIHMVSGLENYGIELRFPERDRKYDGAKDKSC